MARRKRKKSSRKNITNLYGFTEKELNSYKKRGHYNAKVDWKDDKKEVRMTKEWLVLKSILYIKQKGLDPISGTKLNKNCNCHHMNFNEAQYGIFNDTDFLLLNQSNHKFLHQFCQIAHKIGFEELVSRLKKYYNKTEKLNKGLKNFPLAH